MKEVYVLNEDFEEIAVIDNYESFIWTERFDDLGDFELHVQASETVRRLLPLGTVIAKADSYRMMVVETVDELSSETGWGLKFGGRSLERLLMDRVGRSVQSGSAKTWVNYLTKYTFSHGVHDLDDRIFNMWPGTGVIYPPSNIPPSFQPAPFSGSGWTSLWDAYKAAKDSSALGFRILRRPHTKMVYYETYTGNDLTNPESLKLTDKELSWTNPYMFETDEDVEVWANIAFNPGFTQGIKSLSPYNEPFEKVNSGITPKEVEVPWSRSGKGLLIASEEGRTSNSTTVALTRSDGPNLDDDWPSVGKLWGKTVTISARVEIKATQSGTLSQFARKLIVGARKHGAGTPEIYIAEKQAPNTVGIHNVSLTVTLPTKNNTQGYDRWMVYLANGNGVTDAGVIWGDLCVFVHPSNPVGYFDGDYSPDSDLTPVWMPWKNPNGEIMHYSALTGKQIQGTQGTNGVVIQSRDWGNRGDLSARLIKNVSDTSTPYFVIGLQSTARYGITTRYQSKILTATTDFGRVVGTGPTGQVFQTGTKPNQVGAHSLNLSSASNNITGAIFFGGFTNFGESMYWGFTTFGALSARNPRKIEPILFSESLDNFIIDRSHYSDGDYSNVVYVTHKETLMKIDDGYAESGIQRRVVHVDADSLEEGPTLRTEMMAMGALELAKRRRVFLIDGEVPPYSRYKYDVDYSLGDIVMIENRTGNRAFARVVEQIFVSDGEGYRTYPTLREEISLAQGSWYAPQYRITWSQAEPLGTWANQP